jgi:imidazoleglycerol-phosphate dehydratase
MTVISRQTKETQIRVEISADPDSTRIDTSRPFLDHMLVTLARYSGLGISVQARGDLPHHLIEDVAIVLGAALAEWTPPTIARYGDRTVPMDDALVQCTLDLGGRPYYRGRLPSRMYEHFLRSFADNARATVHVRVLRGKDRHHVVEASFKALGLSIRDALVDTGAVFSTKGSAVILSEAKDLLSIPMRNANAK